MGTTASTIITAAFRESNLIPVGKQPTTDEQTEALPRLNAYIQGVYGYELGEFEMDWQIPAPQRTASIAANYPQLPFPSDTSGDIWPLPNATDPSQAIYSYPPKNSRIIFGGVTQTCWFPEAPEPGTRMAVLSGSGAGDMGVSGAVLTLDGNGRNFNTLGDGLGTTTSTVDFTWNGPNQRWIYRDDLGMWVPIQELALTDVLPFPQEFDDLWICLLAIRLAPRYGKTTAPETEKIGMDSMKRLKARYRQSAPTVYGSSDFPRSLQSYISGRWWW